MGVRFLPRAHLPILIKSSPINPHKPTRNPLRTWTSTMPTLTQHLVQALSDVDPYSLSIREARDTIGRTHALSPPDANAKLVKGQAMGWLTTGLSLAPASLAGVGTVCPHSTPQCRAFCVAGSGNAIAFSNVTEARIALTRKLHAHPLAFVRVLLEDLETYASAAQAQGMRLAARLNVFSDLQWEDIAPVLFEVAQAIKAPLYDYTKIPDRITPPGYQLTLSHSEVNCLADRVPELCAAGYNVAIPFAVNRSDPLPRAYRGIRVVDGDASDLRFLDPRGVVVGLRSKVTKAGKAQATGRFVVLP